MAYASPAEVNARLKNIRLKIGKNECTLWPRKKNKDSLALAGLSIDDAFDIVKSLTVRNYCKGPEDDIDKPGTGEMWFFGHSERGYDFYIKIKICFDANSNVIIISFHFPEFPLIYPYK